MDSDIPICFNLSGGVDASVLIALAKQHKKDITAFTYVVDKCFTKNHPVYGIC